MLIAQNLPTPRLPVPEETNFWQRPDRWSYLEILAAPIDDDVEDDDDLREDEDEENGEDEEEFEEDDEEDDEDEDDIVIEDDEPDDDEPEEDDDEEEDEDDLQEGDPDKPKKLRMARAVSPSACLVFFRRRSSTELQSL
jgi:hypothetical protein